MLMHYQGKLDDCIIAGEGVGGVMESSENILWESCSCVDVRILLEFYLLYHVMSAMYFVSLLINVRGRFYHC